MPAPLSFFSSSGYILSYFNLKAVYHPFSVYTSFLLTCLNALRCLRPSSIWAQTHPLNHIGSDLNTGESINKLDSTLFCHTFHCEIIKSIALFKWGIITTIQGYVNLVGFKSKWSFKIHIWHRVGKAAQGTSLFLLLSSAPLFLLLPPW